MKVYSIFDDFTDEAAGILRDAGAELTVHPFGQPRPAGAELKQILDEYDALVIGTSQKMPEEMFSDVHTPKIIGTTSVGLDHIQIPAERQGLISVYNTPKANAQSVAEYTIGCALSCCKRLEEGRHAYQEGRDNKTLPQKPEDLAGKTIGVVGAGSIAERIMDYAAFFGMHILCWTAHPARHASLAQKGVEFVPLDRLAKSADVISVNLPNNEGTRNLISAELISEMKDNVIFISISRLPTIDMDALLKRAEENPLFYVCIDIDVDTEVVKKYTSALHMPGERGSSGPASTGRGVHQMVDNILITPHIAGGTIETRKRMFREVAEQIAARISEDKDK